MTKVQILTSDNQLVEVPFSFGVALDFARSFNGREWDANNKVWNVPFTKADVLEEIENEETAQEIIEFLEATNKVYQGIAYGARRTRGQDYLYTENDIDRLVTMVNEISFEEFEQIVLEQVSDFYMRI